MQVSSEHREASTLSRKLVGQDSDDVKEGVRNAPPAKCPPMMRESGRHVPAKVHTIKKGTPTS